MQCLLFSSVYTRIIIILPFLGIYNVCVRTGTDLQVCKPTSKNTKNIAWMGQNQNPWIVGRSWQWIWDLVSCAHETTLQPLGYWVIYCQITLRPGQNRRNIKQERTVTMTTMWRFIIFAVCISFLARHAVGEAQIPLNRRLKSPHGSRWVTPGSMKLCRLARKQGTLPQLKHYSGTASLLL